MISTEFLLIFNYTVECSLCSMPEKVRQNLNICLFFNAEALLLPSELELWLVGMSELRDSCQSDVAKEYI